VTLAPPVLGSTWRKGLSWGSEAAHARRYTYTVLAASGGKVRWRRSDGLEGSDSLVDWDALYTRDGEPVKARETRRIGGIAEGEATSGRRHVLGARR
jgi:hypothetical protein